MPLFTEHAFLDVGPNPILVLRLDLQFLSLTALNEAFTFRQCISIWDVFCPLKYRKVDWPIQARHY